MDTIIDQDELKAARAESLNQLEQTAKQLSRRAVPAKKQALAEIEETISRIRREWEDKGLVAA